MSEIVIGIDPGKTGAVAVNHGDGWEVFDCPTVQIEAKSSRAKSGKSVRDVPDPTLMAESLREFAGADVHVYIERVGVMPKEGAVGAFNFGKGYGIWLGIIASYQFPHTLIVPQKWKKAMVGTVKDKDASRQRALQLFPYLADKLKRKKDDGRAEAALIGEYGLRELRGGLDQ